jgi:hypothetical protein
VGGDEVRRTPGIDLLLDEEPIGNGQRQLVGTARKEKRQTMAAYRNGR